MTRQLAIRALRAADELQIQIETVNRRGPFVDLSVELTGKADEDAGLSQIDIVMSGSSWPGIVGGEAPQSESPPMLQYIFGPDFVLSKVAPSPPDTLPWTRVDREAFANVQVRNPSGFIDPANVLAGVELTLASANGVEAFDKIVDSRSLRAFTAEIANPEAFDLLSPITTSVFEELALDLTQLTRSTDAEFWFVDDRLTYAKVDYSSLIDELVELGAPSEVRLFDLSDTITIDYLLDGPIVMPAEGLIEELDLASDLTVLEPRHTIGNCYSERAMRGIGSLVALPCDSPHVGEVFEVTILEQPIDAAYPGADEVDRIAADFCYESFYEIFSVHAELSVFPVLFFSPGFETWTGGDREIACVVQYPEPATVEMTALDPLNEFGLVSIYAFREGQCITDKTIVETALHVVDCDSPHFYEAYYSEVLGDDEYPGERELQNRVDEICFDQFEIVLGQNYAKSEFFIERLFPAEVSWEAFDDRLITCLVTSFEPIEGSLIQG